MPGRGTNRVGPRRLQLREDATMAIIFAFNQNFYSGGIFPDFVTGSRSATSWPQTVETIRSSV